MVVEALALALLVVVVAFIYSFFGKEVEASSEPSFKPKAGR